MFCQRLSRVLLLCSKSKLFQRIHEEILYDVISSLYQAYVFLQHTVTIRNRNTLASSKRCVHLPTCLTPWLSIPAAFGLWLPVGLSRSCFWAQDLS